jgi:hypothetical protein
MEAAVEAVAQVNVTRVTVSDRQAPPVPAPYGTEMARGKRGRKDRPRLAAIADPPMHGQVRSSSGGCWG